LHASFLAFPWLPHHEEFHSLLLFSASRFHHAQLPLKLAQEAKAPRSSSISVRVEKSFDELTDAENKIVQYNYIAKNIISSTLNLDEFFRVSQCNSAKECGIYLKSPMREPLM